MNAIIDHHKRKAAREAVASALRSGDLVRPDTCSACASPGVTEAHHGSYESDRWLDVEWLCRACHGKRHAGKGAGLTRKMQRVPPTPSSLGPLLRGLRVSRGVKQADAARLAGVSPPALSLWENGHRRPDAVGPLRAYAAALGCTDDEIAAVVDAFVSDREPSRHLKAHDRLTTERR